MAVLDQFNLEGKVAIVTGGGGLGRAMAKGLAEAGAKIALVDVKEEILRKASEEIRKTNTDVLSLQVDVTESNEVENMVNNVADEWGKIDILLNSAGIVKNEDAEQMSEADWDDVINVNQKGVFLCSREVGKHMIERGEGGSIINISSIAGFVPTWPQPQVSYNASKAAVTMITKSLASEWAEYGIRVNDIAPGYMDTKLPKPFLEENPEEAEEFWIKPTPMKRLGDPDELAGAAVYLASDASSFMTGSTMIIDGGYTVR